MPPDCFSVLFFLCLICKVSHDNLVAWENKNVPTESISTHHSGIECIIGNYDTVSFWVAFTPKPTSQYAFRTEAYYSGVSWLRLWIINIGYTKLLIYFHYYTKLRSIFLMEEFGDDIEMAKSDFRIFIVSKIDLNFLQMIFL